MKTDVTVTYENGSLTIDRPEIDYNPGDWVVWKFVDIPTGSFGFLRFDNAPGLGPFHSLRTYATDVVAGKGNTGAKSRTTFKYTAMLLSREGHGVLAVSGESNVHQAAAPRDTTPDVTVTFCDDPEKPRLHVEPFHLALNTGDTATWHFQDLPEGYFATLQIDTVTAIGPFSAYYITAPQPGQPGGTFEAHAIGFGTVDAKTPHRLEYHIQVRRPDGSIVDDPDPVIDNLGPPIPGG